MYRENSLDAHTYRHVCMYDYDMNMCVTIHFKYTYIISVCVRVCRYDPSGPQSQIWSLERTTLI